jgi:hypothetical protein
MGARSVADHRANEASWRGGIARADPVGCHRDRFPRRDFLAPSEASLPAHHHRRSTVGISSFRRSETGCRGIAWVYRRAALGDAAGPATTGG